MAKVVVIGAGIAGLSAVAGDSKAGAEVILYRDVELFWYFCLYESCCCIAVEGDYGENK